MSIQLPHFSKASILVVGDIMLDRYWFGETARISPEAPVPVVKIKHHHDRPGGAANVAFNIAALNAQVTLLGIAGEDEAAQTLRQHLTAAGVHHAIQTLPGIPTITKLRILSRHQQLIRLDFEENLLAFDDNPLLNAFKEALQTAHLVILSDYGKGTLREPSQFIQLAQKAQVPVLVDPKGLDFTRYVNAHILTPNLKEFEAVMGPCENEKVLLEKGQAFLKQHDIKALLLTRGEQGMTLIQQDQEEFHLPAHAKEVFDVTGAGDTVISVLGTALAAHVPLREAVTLANLAASLVVGKLGTATVSAPELEAALKKPQPNAGVLNEEQLLQIVTTERLRGKRIVFTNGCFDILHAGHVQYLQQAKQLGDYLIVAVNDDASVTRLKGPGRPVNTVEQRMAVLAGLGVVDWVVSFTEATPERLLKKIQPDLLVKGGDYTPDTVVGAPIVLAYGGDVRVLSVIKNLSTTSIINRVVETSYMDNH